MASYPMFLFLLGCLGQLSFAVRVAQRRAEAKPICDQALVLDACHKFGGKTSVRTEDLAERLMISQISATSFLQELGLEGEEVSCEELCRQTVASFPEDEMPPTSDVGCYMSGSERVCDLDLSDKALAAIAKGGSSRIQREGNGIHKVMTAAEAEEMAVELEKIQDASFADLQIQVANWFSIWPLASGEGSGLTALATGGSSNQKQLDRLTKTYVAKTLQKLAAGQLQSMVKKWFGDSSSKTVRLVRSGLQHIQNVMKAPHYINSPNKKGLYGWVEYPFKKARNGTWPIHLGRAYFEAKTPDRVGTLTHEASHFYPLGTDDHMYCDVPGCLRMAKRNARKAQSNGDHFSFFIDEIVGGGMR